MLAPRNESPVGREPQRTEQSVTALPRAPIGQIEEVVPVSRGEANGFPWEDDPEGEGAPGRRPDQVTDRRLSTALEDARACRQRGRRTDAMLVAAVGVHHVERVVAVAGTDEGDLLPVGRDGGRLVGCRVVGQIQPPRAVGGDGVDLEGRVRGAGTGQGDRSVRGGSGGRSACQQSERHRRDGDSSSACTHLNEPTGSA